MTMDDPSRSTDQSVIGVYFLLSLAILTGVAAYGVSEWWLTLPLPLVFHFGLRGKTGLAHILLAMLAIPAFLICWWNEAEPFSQVSLQILAFTAAVAVLIEVVRREFTRRETMNRRIRESEEAYPECITGNKIFIIII